MTEDELQAGVDEIERDRRQERRVVLQALVALAVVVAFVLVRLAIVG